MAWTPDKFCHHCRGSGTLIENERMIDGEYWCAFVDCLCVEYRSPSEERSASAAMRSALPLISQPDTKIRSGKRNRWMWQSIETAPKDGTVIDVWLGNADESDVEFYCTHGTRRAPGWHWRDGKWRPEAGLATLITFVQPTHWMPLPEPPLSPSELKEEG